MIMDTPHSMNATCSSLNTDRKSYTEMVDESKKVLNRVDKLTETLSNQERIIEMNERERREKNIIIMGLEESEESTQGMVSTLLKNKLKLEGIEVVSSRRIGKAGLPRRNPRPILVSLNSVKDKRTIMQNRKKLAGSRIFINNDLTPDQQAKQRELRTNITATKI